MQACLALEPVGLVPPRWLHVSVLDAGFRRDLTKEQRRVPIDAAGQAVASIAPFELEVRNANSFPRTVVLHVGREVAVAHPGSQPPLADMVGV